MAAVVLIASLAFFGWIAYRAAVVALSGEVRDEGRLRYDDADLVELVGERRAALEALRASALDFETGKVADPDYEEVRGEESAEAIGVMQRLDEVRAGFEYTDRVASDLEKLEAEWGALREPPVSTRPADILLLEDSRPGEPALSAAARIRRSLHSAAASCPACGGEVEQDDKFCAQCGGSLEETCAKCDAPLRSGANFCAECGHRVSRSREVSR